MFFVLLLARLVVVEMFYFRKFIFFDKRRLCVESILKKYYACTETKCLLLVVLADIYFSNAFFLVFLQ